MCFDVLLCDRALDVVARHISGSRLFLRVDISGTKSPRVGIIPSLVL